jgi:hypothetical protein
MPLPAPPAYRRLGRAPAAPVADYPAAPEAPLPGVIDGQTAGLNNLTSGETASKMVTGNGGFYVRPAVGTR